MKQINYGLCDSSHHADLDELSGLAGAGKLRAHIDTRFGLDQVPAAFNASVAGHVMGKISIQVAAA